VQEPVDPFDRSKWPGANPALVYGRTDVEFLEEQLQILGPALFAREHLGVWDPPPVDDADNVWQVIAADEWTARLDATAQPGAKVAWSIDVSPDGKSAAIGLSDGSYVEVADFRPGTAWVVPRLKELRQRHGFNEVALDATGPAGMLLSALDDSGVPYRKVTLHEHAQACGEFLTSVTGSTSCIGVNRR
jgi:hypothetical protein